LRSVEIWLDVVGGGSMGCLDLDLGKGVGGLGCMMYSVWTSACVDFSCFLT
jgi:hypothetical protein